MSELIIIGYDDHATAEAAQARVLQLQKDFVIDLSGLAVVRVDDDGKKHIDTPGSIVGVSATSGALWGMIIGLLFLVPGVPLINAVSDLVDGNFLTGIARFAHGSLISFCIALGLLTAIVTYKL